jgi:hypothetical protein
MFFVNMFLKFFLCLFQAFLCHLSATNPSFVNGDKISEKSEILKNGDILAFGDRIFRFKKVGGMCLLLLLY